MSKGDAERSHAIVIGGGIAGLLASRVLLNHFEQVTLLERDHYPEEPVFRAGVPQGRHVHVMLLRGQRALEKLFPGLKTKLLAQGAVERTYGAEGDGASLYYYGARCLQVPAVLQGWNCSRPFLEWHIRQELAKYAHLRIMEGSEVVHLLAEKTEHSVCGVQFRARTHIPTNETQELRGDLVIDASGSSSRVATWLEELGDAVPQEKTILTWVNYATRIYLPAEPNPWKEIAIQTTLPGRPAGAVMEVEGGRWIVSLTRAGQEPHFPTTEEGFLEFARQLPEPALYEAIKSASPISGVYGYRKVENRQRRFHRPPKGFITLGDALCSFNPLYGQGMTIAVLEAQLLDTCLRVSNGKKGLAHLFHKKATRLLAFPWLLAATADATARHTASGGQANYIERLSALFPYDQKAFLTFLEVIHMIRTPLALAHPLLVAKAFTHKWKKRKKL